MSPSDSRILVGVIALCACSSSVRTPDDVSIREERTSGGYSVVHVSGSPPLQAIEKGARAGSFDGPNYMAGVRTVLLDENGEVYVLSLGTRRIMVFDSTGAYARDIGRAGEGPGEFMSPQYMAWHGDTLLVFDGRKGRIGKFNARGDWLGSIPSARMSGTGVKLYGMGRDRVAMPDYVATAATRTEVFINFGVSATADTIPALDSHIEAGRIERHISGWPGNVNCEVGDEIRIFGVGWNPGRFESPAADGSLLVAYGERFRILFLGSKADTLRVLERALAPVLVTDEEWSEKERAFAQFRKPLPLLTKCNRALERVNSHPMLKAVFFDASGNLWVEAHTADGDFFEVFDSRLRLLRRVESVVRDIRIDPYVMGDRMAVVELDSSDVPFVRLYRIGAGR